MTQQVQVGADILLSLVVGLAKKMQTCMQTKSNPSILQLHDVKPSTKSHPRSAGHIR